MGIEELIKNTVQCAFNVRMHLAAGLLESVYQKALWWELQENGIQADMEMPINVYYKDKVVGEFKADLIVEVELFIFLFLCSSVKKTRTQKHVLLFFGSNSLHVTAHT